MATPNPPDYKLTVTSGVTTTTHYFRDLGIVNATVKLSAMLRDVFTFEQDVEDLSTEAAPIARGNVVKLYNHQGACVFAGVAAEPVPIVEGNRFAWALTVEGLGKMLDAVQYRQPWRFPAEVPEEFVTPTTEMNEQEVTLVTLFRQYSGGAGTKIDLWDQLDDILDRAVDDCDDLGWTIAYSLDHIPKVSTGISDLTNVQPPEHQLTDARALEALEVCLRWVPHVTMRADYSSGTPTVRFSAAPSLDGLGNATRAILGTGMTIRSANISDCTGLGARPLDNRLVSTLTIRYLVENSVTPSGAFPRFMYRTAATDTSTYANGAPPMEITIPLRGRLWNGSELTDPEPQPPAGLAKALHQAYGRLWWEFEIEQTGHTPRWEYQIGEGWNILGINADTANAASVAQEITHDLDNGTTRVRTGAPTHLGLGDILDLLNANRKRTVPKHVGEQQYGFGEEDVPDNKDGIGGIPVSFWNPANSAVQRYKVQMTPAPL